MLWALFVYSIDLHVCVIVLFGFCVLLCIVLQFFIDLSCSVLLCWLVGCIFCCVVCSAVVCYWFVAACFVLLFCSMFVVVVVCCCTCFVVLLCLACLMYRCVFRVCLLFCFACVLHWFDLHVFCCIVFVALFVYMFCFAVFIVLCCSVFVVLF